MLKSLRIIGIIEGVSYLVLLLIAMPLKYIWESPQMVQQVGMAHGVLFVLYVALVFIVGMQFKWSLKTIGFALLASIVPWGTFIAEKRIFKIADNDRLKRNSARAHTI
jgi:integral membrane protein